jgi:hypothetical protein
MAVGQQGVGQSRGSKVSTSTGKAADPAQPSASEARRSLDGQIDDAAATAARLLPDLPPKTARRINKTLASTQEREDDQGSSA